MPSTIKIKRSNVAGKIPTTSDIASGELALNIKDQKLYSSNGTGVFQIGGLGGSGGANAVVTKTAIKDLTSNSLVVTNVVGVFVGAMNDYLQVANAATLYVTKVNPATSGLLAHTGRATISTNLSVTGNTVISGLSANGSLGTANYVLKTNGSTTFWGEAAAGGGITTGKAIAMAIVFGG